VNHLVELFILKKQISIRLMKHIFITVKQQLHFVWCR